MVHPRKEETTERGTQMEIALEGLRDGTYMSIDHAVKALGVSRTTLRRRVKGGKTRKEAREPAQLLTQQEEKALADWITSATAAGHPITHRYIKDMAQGIRESRADVQPEYLRPIGKNWMGAFLQRHSHLKTKLARAIEAARMKEVTREQVINFNNEFRKIIQEKNIKLENIYNCDETGIINPLIQANNRKFYRHLSRYKRCHRHFSQTSLYCTTWSSRMGYCHRMYFCCRRQNFPLYHLQRQKCCVQLATKRSTGGMAICSECIRVDKQPPWYALDSSFRYSD
jgi:hypothetical protein